MRHAVTLSRFDPCEPKKRASLLLSSCCSCLGSTAQVPEPDCSFRLNLKATSPRSTNRTLSWKAQPEQQMFCDYCRQVGLAPAARA